MGAPYRTVGLPIHLLYPILSLVLLAIAAFSSASSVWYVSAETPTLRVRFAATDYCGYNMSNLVVIAKVGCISRGWEWQIPQNYFGFPVPEDVAVNLSRVAVTSAVAFGLVLVAGLWHAYVIRYSFRKSPAPNKDKLYSCALIHFVSVSVVFMFTWIAFIAQAAVIGNATKYSGDLINGNPNEVAIQWGQSSWLVLGAAVIHFGWGYEAVRWRAAILK
ncbi:uncharacterized protein MKK02DRAFT_39849 [Dioszegia hungarica]|uniref:Uncharacterized protein n=1 Tax=Dioszegia hungarica TaxID=4972 RepID=A0AA38LZ11_9TREE|nr:uncharacterized protein MKK02DRAFT_39849 [Dioszegia hungarica]KAI9639539.1 hypothetical protein MKK02DRAFT_39849 [Dioszegia hungarica]